MSETPQATRIPIGSRDDRRRLLGHLGLLLGLTLVGFLWGSRSLPLMDPEEPRCALVVREMQRSGDWTEMHLHGVPYFDKPAPYFWLCAWATRLTGSAELGGRGVSAVAGIVAVLIAYFLTRRIFGPQAALAAGVMLATCGEFAFIARWYRMEMPTAVFMWGALLCFWRMEDEFRRTGVMKRAWWYGFYACGAVATLFKGPVGVGLPGLVVVVYLLLSGRPKRVFEPLHLGGILLYFAIAAPWYIIVSMKDPGYAYQFFVRQNLTRYGGKIRDEMFYITYLPVLVLGALPWSMWLVMSLVRTWPRPWKSRMENPGVLFVWVMLLVPFIFFQLSGTKLIHYILPVFLPAAVLMGGLVGRFLDAGRPGTWEVAALVVTCALVSACPLVLEMFSQNLDAWLIVPGLMAAGGAVAVWFFTRRGRRAAAVAATAAVVVGMYFYIIAHDAPVVYDHRCAKALAVLVPDKDRLTSRFIAYEKNSLSFEYYADVEAEHIHEGNSGALLDAFRGTQHVYTLLDDDEDRKLVSEAQGFTPYLVGKHREMILMSNGPPTLW